MKSLERKQLAVEIATQIEVNPKIANIKKGMGSLTIFDIISIIKMVIDIIKSFKKS
jgi:hypothetical protein